MHPLAVQVLLTLLACSVSQKVPAVLLADQKAPPRHLRLHQLRDGASVNATEHHRLIITGCLQECSTEDQSCVTDCQVCAEKNKCPSLLVNCTSCLNEARDTRLHSLNAMNLAMDSGGISLKREGLREELVQAKFEASDAKRKLRVARGIVLQAQRDAEFAMQQSKDEISSLAAVKKTLRNEKLKAAEWELRNAKKVKKMRAEVAELRVEHMRTLSHLREVRAKLHFARKRVKEHPNDQRAVHDVAVFSKSWQQLRWKVEEQREAVKEAEAELKKEQDDASWVLKGIRKDVRGAAKDVEHEYHRLHDNEESERAARKRLNLAKQQYQELADRSQELASKTADLRMQLRAIQPPDFSGEGPDEEEGPESDGMETEGPESEGTEAAGDVSS